MDEGAFLIVDDEPLVTTVLQGVLRPHGRSVVARSAADARRELERRRRWRGFLVDVGLPDGSGLDLLAELLHAAPETPSLVMSGTLDREIVNRAAALDARFLCKPWKARDLAPFLDDAAAAVPPATPTRVAQAAARARQRWGLSPREVEVVTSALRQEPRATFVARRQISVNTFKTRVRRILEKSDYPSLKSLAIDLLSDADEACVRRDP